MNKADFVTRVSEKTGETKAAVSKMIDAFEEVITEGLKEDGRVTFGKIGYFNVSYRAERIGRNPQAADDASATITIPETAAVTFKTSAPFKREIAVPEIIAAAKERAKK